MDNSNDDEDRIRQLAYRKWEEAGRPYGEGDRFWLEAQQELSSADGTAQDPGQISGSHDRQVKDAVQMASEQSFPASDAPSWTGATVSGDDRPDEV